jgi:para-nitrobenzyl esterase
MKRLSLLVVFGGLFVATARVPAALPDSVRVDGGTVSGTSGASGEIRMFKGIPYAAPPIGDLRWKAPRPVAHWDGVRQATQFAARCMQGGFGGGGGRQGGGRQGRQTGAPPAAAAPAAPAAFTPPAQPPTSEDCLYLNVWTPATSASDRKPVMVFTYGGGFTSGAGSEPRYDGEALAKKGVVVVTSNYRLGAFGWFAHPELTKESGHHASGNYGLMDAVAALKWVQKNIAAFGGDPSNVTIFGESAGAFSVASMVGSPEAKGLFRHAIAESGAWMGIRMGRMTTLAQAEDAGQKMADAMGAKSIADLRAKSADDLLRDGRPGGMIVDGWYVPEDLSNTFAQGKQNDVDILVGSNQDEGTFFQRQGPPAAQFVTQIKERWSDLADSFLTLYPAATDEQANTSSLSAMRDEMTWHARLWAELTAKRGKKAYVYYFTHVPPAAPGQPSRGATHTAELAYVFSNLIPANRDWPDVDKKLADAMSTYWANFARNGDPNGNGLPVWPAYKDKTTSGRAMILGDKIEPEATTDAARLALYDSLYSKQMAPAVGRTASR